MNKFLLFGFLISLILFSLSCSEDYVNNPVGNQPPNTGLFLYPDSTISQQPSRLQVHWWGDDPDGTILGFYFMWEGLDSTWMFTTKNDSVFSLPIGSADTTYNILVSAVDTDGNGVYNSEIIRNGTSYGPEPFIDENENGMYDEGEIYYDVGLIDPTPASLSFPIKNTPPVLEWNELSVLPDSSFPVMTFRWNADDLDGTETIQSINIALNDTSNFVTLDGSIRLITIRIEDLQSTPPQMEILINGSDQNIFQERLPGLLLDADNKFYVQAVDLSGAKSNRIMLPDTNQTWYVKKPRGKVLIFDDLSSSSSSNLVAEQFYRLMFNSIGGGSVAGKFDEYDLEEQVLPFENLTLYETLKLFPYLFWYSGSNPRLDLLNIVTNKFIQQGGKIAFSMTLQDSSMSFPFDLSTLQGFLPIDSVSAVIPQGFLLSGADVLPLPGVDYLGLKTSATIAFVRTLEPNELITDEVYKLSNPQISGTVGFISKEKNEFFIGLPLHQCNGGDENVDELFEKIFFEEFGLIP